MNALILLLVSLSVCCAESGESDTSGEVEARGKAKYALLIHFFYVAASKLFILKIVYGIIFYVLVVKGWHFVLWFVHYLKHNKHEEYIEHPPIYHDHDHGHGHQGYGGPYQGYEPSYHGNSQAYQGYESFDSYGYDKKGYETGKYANKKKIYDSDGSYSVSKPVVSGGKYARH
ncbi:hypothetical protein ABMA28_006659 [Loxostege sticticalis]|uniref:Uncharacterized protein n=1 Tax=Loxostege sticticalis TaxID=481309 RepID=A0ABD0TNA4_LOXSC